MTTDQSTAPEKKRSTWKGRAIAIGVGLVVVVTTYFILAAVAPRWWSIRVGDLAGQTFHRGIGWGLTFGLLCTLVPLLLLWGAVAARKSRVSKPVAILSAIAALAIAAPNLLTLSIVLGTGNAAHAGERTLDTEAPGFRGATGVGAIIAVVVFAALVYFVVRTRRRRALKKATRDAQQAS